MSSTAEKLPLSDIFPLTYRPFGKHWYPAPRRPVTYLRTYYSANIQRCSSHTWSHALEKPIPEEHIDCRKLMQRYAFVHRCPIPEEERDNNPVGFCDEHLVDGSGRSVHKVRTALDGDEIDIPLYTVRHEAFRCCEDVYLKNGTTDAHTCALTSARSSFLFAYFGESY
ncbi:unnamed protein product [Hydatigera taeniaeformis]|uniref:Uncharacterized protein n=1 Tax=Hydatigena taeniaeformis TaxID=6205 RepID=A0A0R3WU05_HYDTA|nr:unnamed protein product [Hydatigera taeniaeformis]